MGTVRKTTRSAQKKQSLKQNDTFINGCSKPSPNNLNIKFFLIKCLINFFVCYNFKKRNKDGNKK